MPDRRGRLQRHWLLVQELAGDDHEAERVGSAVFALLDELGHSEADVTVSTHRQTDERPSTEAENDDTFLDGLCRLSEDWRYSDEFIGLVVRRRFPRRYDDLGRRSVPR